MSIVAEFVIPPDAVPGGAALEEMPQTTIELERIVPTGDAVLPFFWVFGDDPDSFLELLGREPEIADVRVLTEIEDGALFEATWTPESAVIEGIETLDATILTAVGTADEWEFRVRAESRDRLAAFQRIFTEQGIPVNLNRVFNFAELVEGDRPLTPRQRETLIAAYRGGYFEQPKEISQAELGEQFGISGRAVSNRLRRGTRNLIANSLLDPQREVDGESDY